MTELEEKAAFAALFLKSPNDPFKAATELFPHNTNRALKVAVTWPKDAEVLELKEKLLNEAGGEMGMLPSKAELARDIWNRMQGTTLPDGRVIPVNPDDYTKLAKLYADVRGFIEKAPTVSVNNNVIVPKAIEVPTHGTDAEWQAALAAQQKTLLDVSRSKH